MKLKIALVTAALMTPTLGFAMGCSGAKHETSMSCAAGSTYDSATGSCQPVST